MCPVSWSAGDGAGIEDEEPGLVVGGGTAVRESEKGVFADWVITGA